VKEVGDFKKEVLDHEGVTIVDFYTPICPPCRMLMPILQDLSSKYRIRKVNGFERGDICKEYNVSRVPVLIFFKDGEIVKRIDGMAKKKDIERVMEELMAKTTANNDISGEK